MDIISKNESIINILLIKISTRENKNHMFVIIKKKSDDLIF